MELRKDYILDRWVIIAERRGKRPDQFKQQESAYADALCFFCPGNENTTPPEIGRIEKDGKWNIRWFPNKFNFVEKEGDPSVKTADRFFTYSNPVGSHEVIVETELHNGKFHELPVNQIKDVLKVYAERTRELSQKSEYVVIFKNYGKEAAASLPHNHSQVASINIVPPNIRDESIKSIVDGKCLYCDIINIEKKSFRRVFESERFVSFCPYASRFNFECWIFPKDHIKSIVDFDEGMLMELAEMLKKVLMRLSDLKADYNFVLHYAPKNKDLHFHIEILPRISKFAGFEFSSGIIVNAMSPEVAASFYRGD